MSFFLNLRIARKLVAGFAVLVALVGGVSAFTVARVSFLDQSAEWMTHTYGVLGGLDDALLGIVNQETGLRGFRSEEHTSELQSLMRISYAVFCLKKKKQ